MKIIKQLFEIIIVCCVALYCESAISEQGIQINSLPEASFNSSMSIERDIKDLSEKGKKVSIAGERLISRGDLILKYAHAALLNKETTSQQKDLLVFILGEIGSEKSVMPIVSAARSSPDDVRLNIRALSALKYFRQNDEVVQYVNQKLEDKSSNSVLLRSALEYFTVRPHKRAYHWANKYSEPGIDMNVKSMALYLGALLSIDNFKFKIVEALKNKNTNTDEGYMLIALAALTKPDEFNSFIKNLRVNKTSTAVARLYYYLHKGTQKDRRAAAIKVVRGRQGFLLKDAVNYLIEIGDADALEGLWRDNDKTVKTLVSKAGYSIKTSVRGAKFVEKSQDQEDTAKKNKMTAEDFDEFCSNGVANAFDRHCVN